jgi:hypothetical protein
LLALYKAFMDIVMQRRGPQDLPASALLFVIALLAYAIVGVASLRIYIVEPQRIVAELIVNLAALVAFYALLLQLKGFRTRLLQTLTALLGCDAILSTFAWPMHWWHESLVEGDPVGVVPLLGIFMVLFWSFAVAGHILRHALEIPYLAGIMVAMSQFAVSVGVTAGMLGDQG